MAVTFCSLGLIVRPVRPPHVRAFVPVDPQPAKTVQNGLQRLLDIPPLVRVVDPQQELTAVVPGEQPVEEGRADAADVQIAGRAGSETGANHGGGVSGEW